jgi:WD repeat-containing protein 48
VLNLYSAFIAFVTLAMAPLASRRRVSYIIPPPTDPVPRLQLPPHGVSRLGSVGPLLMDLESRTPVNEPAEPKWLRHPRHRLGVASLALDTSTQLASRASPEGILYTGGRDGLVISWDLEIRMKKRERKASSAIEEPIRRSVGRWEIMTGWVDDIIHEEGDEVEEKPADGDVLGEVMQNDSRRRKSTTDDSIPYEHGWETDLQAFRTGKVSFGPYISFASPSHSFKQPSLFRQCAQIHTDWVNDILLCNQNQTLVSASSDGTIKAWNPHSPTSPDPSTIGSHTDYVRCLSHWFVLLFCCSCYISCLSILSREQNWIVSGSFDRTVKLWDMSGTTSDPLITLNPPDPTASKASIYAMAADPFGRTIASGSPERVIRMWDPRSGKRTGKLVGHTDNIRAILISEDSRYVSSNL